MDGGYDTSYWILPTAFNSYNGSTLAEELMVELNDGLYEDMKVNFEFNVEYNYVESQLKHKLIDLYLLLINTMDMLLKLIYFR